MRGEHCIAGASILSAISLILLVFVNIGQIKPGAVTNGLYFLQVDLSGLSKTYDGANVGGAGGVMATSQSGVLGASKGASYTYRYSNFGVCGYDNSNVGACNTTFAQPYNAYEQIATDIPQTRTPNPRTVWFNLGDGTNFANSGYNKGISIVGGALIFVGSIFCVLGLIFGVVKLRLSFLVASACAGLSALLLMIGASMWSALIARNGDVSTGTVGNKVPVGIVISAGPSLYLTWVAFALEVLALIPYVISCCTFQRKARDEGQWK